MIECKFIPYQKVLVRDANDQKWHIELFEKDLGPNEKFRYMCLAHTFTQCVSYEGNEHLLDTDKPFVEPYEPKDGDFVVCENKGEGPKSIFIFNGWNNKKVSTYCIFFCSGSKFSVGLDERTFNSEKGFLRKATEEEKQLLLSKLHENGKEWNAETKEFEDYKWVPEAGAIVYVAEYGVFSNSFYAKEMIWNPQDSGCRMLIDSNRVFKTENDCLALCERLTQAIADVK